jgi:hypothetical protein
MRSHSSKRTLLDDMEDIESSYRGDMDDPDIQKATSLIVSPGFVAGNEESDEDDDDDEDDSVYEIEDFDEEHVAELMLPDTKLPQVQEEDQSTENEDDDQDKYGALPPKLPSTRTSYIRTNQKAGYEASVFNQLDILVSDESSSSFSDNKLPHNQSSLTSFPFRTSSVASLDAEEKAGGVTSQVDPENSDDSDEMVRTRRSAYTGRGDGGRRSTYGMKGGENLSPMKALTSKIGQRLSLTISHHGGSTRDSTSSHAKSERASYRPSEFNRGSSSVAAAAAAVQASQTNRRIQFGQGEYALVQLSRLTISEQASDKDLITIAPVNKYGYPVGEGKNDKQKQPPHYYVLCLVVKVHFDEDERYYTVRRMDTDAEQRADPGFDWMEQIRNSDDITIAMKAAKRSKKSVAENQDVEKENTSCCWKIFAYPAEYVETVAMPFYRDSRNSAKALIASMLRGENKFACNIHITGINVLVLFSFIFLFLGPVKYTIEESTYDNVFFIVGL